MRYTRNDHGRDDLGIVCVRCDAVGDVDEEGLCLYCGIEDLPKGELWQPYRLDAHTRGRPASKTDQALAVTEGRREAPRLVRWRRPETPSYPAPCSRRP